MAAPPTVAQGVTWGTPWPRGKQRETKNFALRGADEKLQPLQSWPLAYWPDGSLKWTAHALAAAVKRPATGRSKWSRDRRREARRSA